MLLFSFEKKYLPKKYCDRLHGSLKSTIHENASSFDKAKKSLELVQTLFELYRDNEKSEEEKSAAGLMLASLAIESLSEVAKVRTRYPITFEDAIDILSDLRTSKYMPEKCDEILKKIYAIQNEDYSDTDSVHSSASEGEEACFVADEESQEDNRSGPSL